MMIASTKQPALRHPITEHRTEPRIVLRMQGSAPSAKLKPTTFVPSAILRFPERSAEQ